MPDPFKVSQSNWSTETTWPQCAHMSFVNIDVLCFYVSCGDIYIINGDLSEACQVTEKPSQSVRHAHTTQILTLCSQAASYTTQMYTLLLN